MREKYNIFPRILACALAGVLISSFSFSKEKVSVRREAAAGLHKVIFEDSSGYVIVHFPDDIRAGTTFSGAIISEPEGKTEGERQKNKARLDGRVVEVEKQRVPVKNQEAVWTLPADIASSVIDVVLKDDKGKEIGRGQIPCFSRGHEPDLQHPEEKPSEPPHLFKKAVSPERPSVPQPDDFLLPKIGQTGKSGVIRGRFDAKFGTTFLLLGDKKVKLLAESSGKLVFECPFDVVGLSELKLKESDVEVSASMTNVGVELWAPTTLLKRRQSTTLDIKATGLKYINQDIPLVLKKSGPITMEGGDEQVVLIKPEHVSPEGTYHTKRTITGNQVGSFGVEATITVPEIKIWLLSPPPNSEIPESRPVFKWSVTPAVRNIAYALKICEQLPGQTLSETIDNPPHFLARDISQTQFQYPPDAQPLEKGRKYAFLVKGLDQGMLIAKSGIAGFWFTGPMKKDPCEELRLEVEKLEKALKDKEDEKWQLPQDRDNTLSELYKCEEELAKAKKARDKAKDELQVKKNLKDNAEKYDRPDKEQRKKDYEEAKKRFEDAENKIKELENKCEELKKKLKDIEEREKKLPGETEALKKKLEELKEKLNECEEKEREKTRAEQEKREREEQEKREREEAAKREREAEKEEIEHIEYLLKNIQDLGLIKAPGFWEAPGLWNWLPELLRVPVGKLAEKLGKVPVPTGTLPALAGVYQIAAALLDPCGPDGKRKTVERLMNRVNSKTGNKYTLNEALDKTEQMCELLTKLKKLAELAQKKK